MNKEYLRRTDGSTFVFIPPQKGVDYWTPADQESIVQQVLTALGTPVFGRVDANKNIILTGELADGVYKLWYEDENGKMTELCTYDTSPEYINWIKRSVEADGTPYNGGQGWKANTRLSSSGAESTSDAAGMECTGFIPFKRGDVIRFSGITMNRNSTNANRCYFIQYKDNDSGEKEMLKSWVVSGFNYAITQGWVLADADGNITQINTADFADESNTEATVPIYTTAQYFRISADEINDDSIITINQEIPEEEPTYINQIHISTDENGAVYNGTGYKVGVRLSSTGEEKELDASATEPAFLTGFIPIKSGDVIRFKNCYMDTNDVDATEKYGQKTWGLYITYFDKDKIRKNGTTWSQLDTEENAFAADLVVDVNGYCTGLTFRDSIDSAGYQFARFTLAGNAETAVIIKINEPIV